jgi:hypothetical protein
MTTISVSPLELEISPRNVRKTTGKTADAELIATSRPFPLISQSTRYP